MIIPQTVIDDMLNEDKTATEGVTDVANTAFKAVGKTAKGAMTLGKAALSVKGSIGKSSITRMGEDSILQFPAVFSNYIDTDDAIAIAKMLERHYATLLVSIFSLRPTVSLNEFDNIAEYIKSIHSNNAIPTNLKKAQHFANESYTENDEDFCLVEGEESAFGVNAETFEISPEEGSRLASECWGVYGGQLDTDLLNAEVQPYTRSIALINDRLEMAKNQQANEGFVDAVNKLREKSSNVVNTGKNTSPYPDNRAMNRLNSNAGVVRNSNNRLINSEPTMINVSFYMHGSKSGQNGAGANFTQNVVLGVKSMVRSVTSDYMVANLVEGTKTSNPIFKFIAWTRGEYKLVKDLIFNISEIKKKFKNKNDDKYGFLEMSKNRKDVDNVSKFAGNRILPYLSLVVSSTEVQSAANITGVDLSDYRNAKAFMDKYYLLAFAIYNEQTKVIDILYDGDSSFDTMSMTYIQGEQKKAVDVTKALSNLYSMR